MQNHSSTMRLISPISFMLAVQVIDKSGPGKIHEVILVLYGELIPYRLC